VAEMKIVDKVVLLPVRPIAQSFMRSRLSLATGRRSFGMRKMIWILFVSGANLTIQPTHAQTFDPKYPFCMQLATIDGLQWNCEYTSLAQCAASASGRPASCMMNPYFAQGWGRPLQRRRPH
jgi:Protein of unknown function (DUF3551)